MKKKAIKKEETRKRLIKYEKERIRELRKQDGYFDGRFRHRVEAPKNKYKRKTKHKNK